MTGSFPPIILASSSPRRAALLRAAGIPFELQTSSVNEDSIRAASHREFVMKAALAKALDVASKAERGAIVIGADTIVCLDDERLGKPTNREEARSMLRRLQAREHRVLTGLAVCRAGGESLVDCVATAVWLGAFPDEDLEACLNSSEPYDKAGAYAIQGWAGRYLQRIEGDWHNVVGLPVKRLIEMLSEFTDVSQAIVPDGREAMGGSPRTGR